MVAVEGAARTLPLPTSLYYSLPRVGLPFLCIAILKPGFAHGGRRRLHPSLNHAFLRLHSNAAHHPHRLGLRAVICMGSS